MNNLDRRPQTGQEKVSGPFIPFGKSAAPLAETKRPLTAWTSENPQDENRPETQDGKDFNDGTSKHLLATLGRTPIAHSGRILNEGQHALVRTGPNSLRASGRQEVQWSRDKKNPK
jgi:hypothetical protein